MITMTSFGSSYGPRLGNQLFQIASLIGLAQSHGVELRLPRWKYAEYFEGPFPNEPEEGHYLAVKEPVFHYTRHWPTILDSDCDLSGYFQSEKYWNDCCDLVRKTLTFKKEFKDKVWNEFMSKNVDEDFHQNPKPTLAISIRRGDYVGNPQYTNLPITYFILAMFEHFPDWKERNIIIFSDDIAYCKVHFDCLPNTYFSEGNSDVEDLCLLSQCDDFIIPNSTFGWWGAYLGREGTKVIRPARHFEGRLKRECDIKDLYPESWIPFDHIDDIGQVKRLNLKDCSFQIPVFYDHEDRNENLGVCLRILRNNFDAEFVVMENRLMTNSAETSKFTSLDDKKDVIYKTFYSDVFWRTKMLNDMARDTKKTIIFNWDADVLIAPLQVWLTAESLRNGADMCFPYEWAFARIPRKPWFTKLRDYEDIGLVGSTKFNGMNEGDAVSVGGAVAWRRASFLSIGGENIKMLAYGPEDCDRVYRARKLGLKIDRVKGPMYHINHWIGSTSNMSNPYYSQNKQEQAYIESLSEQELREHIKTW